MSAILMSAYMLLAALIGGVAQNQTPAGVWNGAISLPTTELMVSVNLQKKDDGSWTGTIDIPMQNAKGLPLSNIGIEAKSISFSIGGIPGNPTFKGNQSDDGNSIAGDFIQGAGQFKFKLSRSQNAQAATTPRRTQEPVAPFPYQAVDVTFENKGAGIKLAGTLTLPRSTAAVPAVVLITGSGAQDRDESIAGHKPFLVLADYLTRRGIAVLRVDDRGVGGSTGSTPNSTTADFATDAIAAVEFLKGRAEINPKRIGLIGHSEGGLVAPLAATKSSDVAFIVLMAGPGLPGDQILYAQAAAMMKASGAPVAAIAQNRKVQEGLIAIAKSEDATARDSNFRAMLDKMLSGVPDSAKQAVTQQMEGQYRMVSTPWFRSFLSYDPRPVLRSVKCPVLAMIGENDLQVPYQENLSEIEAALKAGGNTDYTVIQIPELNHLFQTSKTGLPAEYSQIDETIAPRALQTIGDWIARHVH